MTKINKTPSAEVMIYFTPGKPEYTQMMKTVNKIAGNYSRKSPVDFSELQSIGLLAAWEAAVRFIKNDNNTFMTYAYTYIQGYIKNEIKIGIAKQDTDTSLEERLEMGVDDWSEDLTSAIEANVEVKQALSVLNDRERFVLVKRAQGYSLKEVGEMLGAQNGTGPVTHVYVLKIERKARETLEKAHS